jgi:amino acid transporter
MFGLFSNSLLDAIGVDTGFWTAAAGGLFAVVVIAYLTRHDIRLSASVAALLMLVEVAFVTLLALIVVIDQGRHGLLSTAPFHPGAATHGVDGFKQAALFAVLAVAGYDVIAPVAEETRRPRRLIPVATFIMAIAAGTYWVLTSYAFVESVPQSTMASYVDSGQFTPIYLVADHYIGVLRVLVPLTGMTAVFACYTAGSTAASRLLYALARDGFGPARLARVDPRTQTPWQAQVLVLSLCAVMPIVLGRWQGTYLGGFAWVAQAMVFFILCLYLLVNVSNIAFHLRFERASFNRLTNLVVPVAAIAIVAYILYASWLDELLLHGGPFRSTTSIAWFSLAWAFVGVVVTAWQFRAGVERRADDLTALPERPAHPAAQPPGPA